MHRLQELVRLHRMGTGAREVARLLGMSPNTEREYRIALEAEGLLAGAVDDLPALEVLKAAVERAAADRRRRRRSSTVEACATRSSSLPRRGSSRGRSTTGCASRTADFDGELLGGERGVAEVARGARRARRGRRDPRRDGAGRGRAGRLRLRRQALRPATPTCCARRGSS